MATQKPSAERTRRVAFPARIVALACWAVQLLGCGAATPAPERSAQVRTPAKPETVSLIALNDLHGRIERLPIYAGYVDILRELRRSEGGSVLVLDAGDIFQGTLESNLFEGATAIEAYNLLGLDAATIGNHEFDFGPVGPRSTPGENEQNPHGALRARLLQARFPFVSANLQERATNQRPAWENLWSSVVLERGGKRFGVVGALTAEAPEVIKSANFADLSVLDPAIMVADEARKLRARGVDAVIALVHLGGSCSRLDDPNDLSSCELHRELFQFADRLPSGLVDVVLSGHHHAPVAHYYRNMALLQAYWAGNAFSRADLHFGGRDGKRLEIEIHPPQQLCEGDPDPSVSGDCHPFSYEGRRPEVAPRIANVIERASQMARSVVERPLGVNVTAEFRRDKGGECALGNLLVDLMRSSTPDADIAISNAGSLRSDLPAGPLTYGALYRVMPFDNRLSIVQLRADELRHMLKAHLLNQEHGLVSISGLQVVARCEDKQLQVDLWDASGQPIADATDIRVLTSDFLATGGDDIFTPARVPSTRVVVDIGIGVRESLVAAIGQRSQLDPSDRTLFDASAPRLDLRQAQAGGCLTPHP